MELYTFLRYTERENTSKTKADHDKQKGSSQVNVEENWPVWMNPLYEDIYVEESGDVKKYKNLKKIWKMQKKQIACGSSSISCWKLEDCGNHFYHKRCLLDLAKHGIIRNERYVIRCVVCSKQYGSIYGDMPKGTMNWSKSTKECDGFESYGSYRIVYQIEEDQSGIFERKAYVPANPQGKKCLAVLIELFKHRFTFCTARSLSNPDKKSVFWGKIFHKSK